MKFLLINFFVLLLSQPVWGQLMLSDAVNPAVLFNPSAKASFKIQARVYFGNEDEEERPIKNEFYLLDESLIKILQGIHLKPEFEDGKSRKVTNKTYFEAAAQALTSDGQNFKTVTALIKAALRQHQIARIQTDENGDGKTRTVKTGIYYLFGVEKVEDEILVWHQPVKIIAGKNQLEIDQYNADLIIEP